MEVRMEHTEGLGRKAEVWIAGQLLGVCDNLSTADKRIQPGPLEGVTFTYVSYQHGSWEQAISGNPNRKKELIPVRDWAYEAYGQIVQIMPVTIDFGVLRMADPNWSRDEKLVGRFVKVDIDRLEIRPAHKPDWPEGMR